MRTARAGIFSTRAISPRSASMLSGGNSSVRLKRMVPHLAILLRLVTYLTDVQSPARVREVPAGHVRDDTNACSHAADHQPTCLAGNANRSRRHRSRPIEIGSEHCRRMSAFAAEGLGEVYRHRVGVHLAEQFAGDPGPLSRVKRTVSAFWPSLEATDLFVLYFFGFSFGRTRIFGRASITNRADSSDS